MQFKNKYRAFGLNIASEIELPELAKSTFDKADVKIGFGPNPIELSDIEGRGVLFQAKENDFLFRLETVGSFRVQNGNTVTIEKLNDSADEEVRLFLLGSAMGALIQQRGILPIHGSSIIYKGKGIIFSGQSGAGKSSIAEVFVKRGNDFVADDICSINFNKHEQICVEPGIPYVKLWKDVIDHLKYDTQYLAKVRPELQKYKKTVPSFKPEQLSPLKIIFIIHPVNSPQLSHKHIVGAEKMQLLKNNVYRYQYANGLKQKTSHFKMLANLASKCTLVEIYRPSSPLQLEKLADYIQNILDSEQG